LRLLPDYTRGFDDIGKLMIEWLKRHNTPIDTMGVIIATALTMTALFVAYIQYSTQWSIEHERQAKSAYYDFMKISMENPLYSKPDLRGTDLTALEYEGYYWYIQIMSQTFEQVFRFVPEQKNWNATAVLQFRLHCGYFAGDEYLAELHTQRFQSLVQEAIVEEKIFGRQRTFEWICGEKAN
jgi:hypothetical protein